MQLVEQYSARRATSAISLEAGSGTPSDVASVAQRLPQYNGGEVSGSGSKKPAPSSNNTSAQEKVNPAKKISAPRASLKPAPFQIAAKAPPEKGVKKLAVARPRSGRKKNTKYAVAKANPASQTRQVDQRRQSKRSSNQLGLTKQEIKAKLDQLQAIDPETKAPPGETELEKRRRRERVNGRRKRAKKMIEINYLQERQTSLTDSNAQLKVENEELRRRIAMVTRVAQVGGEQLDGKPQQEQEQSSAQEQQEQKPQRSFHLRDSRFKSFQQTKAIRRA